MSCIDMDTDPGLFNLLAIYFAESHSIDSFKKRVTGEWNRIKSCASYGNCFVISNSETFE